MFIIQLLNILLNFNCKSKNVLLKPRNITRARQKDFYKITNPAMIFLS